MQNFDLYVEKGDLIISATNGLLKYISDDDLVKTAKAEGSRYKISEFILNAGEEGKGEGRCHCYFS